MRRRRTATPRLPETELILDYVQVGRIGTSLTYIPWYEVAVEAGWVWRGEEGWRLVEDEGRRVGMEVSKRGLVERPEEDSMYDKNRLVVVGVKDEVTLFVGWEDV